MMPLPSTGFELRDVEVVYGDRRILHGLESTSAAANSSS